MSKKDTENNNLNELENMEADQAVGAEASSQEEPEASDHEKTLETQPEEDWGEVNSEEGYEGEEPSEPMLFSDEELAADAEADTQKTDEDSEDDSVVDESMELMQITDDEAISVIESLLFISDRPVGMTTFKNAFAGTDVNTKKIKNLIAEMQADLAQVRRGVSLEEVDGAFQLRTKMDNQDFIKKITKAKTFKLTGPSLEALAVVAYKQPCIKADVDEVRGVESGHLVRALMDKGLVAFAGKSDLPGKPMFYKTTRKFLEIFGLRNISELPTLKEMEELLPEGIGDEEEKETLSEVAQQLKENYEGNYSVAEEELGKITEQLAGITTNTEFFEEEKRKQKEKQDRERAESLQEALALGEEIESKDQKWLDRYEAKQAEALAAEEAQAQNSDDDNVDESFDASADESSVENAVENSKEALPLQPEAEVLQIIETEVPLDEGALSADGQDMEEDFDFEEEDEEKAQDPLDLL